MPGSSDADLAAVVRALVRATREMADAVEIALGQTVPIEPPWQPNDLQSDVLAALDGKAMRTDALATAIGRDRRRLFDDPGGLNELQERGRVQHSTRCGFFRPDAPPK